MFNCQLIADALSVSIRIRILAIGFFTLHSSLSTLHYSFSSLCFLDSYSYGIGRK